MTDYGQYLEDYIQSVENLPHEIAHLFNEIQERGNEITDTRDDMKDKDLQLRNLIKNQQVVEDETKTQLRDQLTDEQRELYDAILNGFTKIDDISGLQIKTAERALAMVDRHMRRLQNDIDKINELEGLPPSTPIPKAELKVPQASARRKTSISRPTTFSTPAPPRRSFKRKYFVGNMRFMNRNDEEDNGEVDESLYCFCQQVSYGEMIGCENGEECPFEWFHLDCVGLTEPPTGVWYCPDCSKSRKKRSRGEE